jgi:IPT/TIG domain
MADSNPKPVSAPTDKSCRCRVGIFAYDLIVVLVLLIGGVVYVKNTTYYSLGADNLNISVRAMWFGALGGIVISLKGVYDHCCQHGDWDDCFDLWHLGRPVSGALAGLITLVLLLAVNSTSPNEPVVYAIAFIFGTQERRFFNFLYKVAALVVTVPDDEQKTGLKGTAIQPLQGREGTLVLITGQGFAPDATVTIGDNKLNNVVVAKDGTAIVGNIPAAPGGPAGAVAVTIANPGGEHAVLPVKFTYMA